MARIFLLIIIYIAFISLGLPDSALGVAWPSMRNSLGLPLEAAGIFAMVTTVGTAFSSFISGHVLKKLGTGKVVFLSCAMTGTALLGYSFAPSFNWLLLLTIPLGLGAGAVDTGLNNYVANNFSARHMSWLHCFWGVGAFMGPNIMNLIIVNFNNWRMGYRVIGFLQLFISLILFSTLRLWKKNKENDNVHEEHHVKVRGLDLFRKKGVLLSILAFPVYIGVEGGIGLWLGSYLIEGKGTAQIKAGIIVSLFYLSITIGRFLNGIITEKFSNKQLIRIGIIIMIIGVALFNISLNTLTIPSVILIGLGCAPIFPSMIHETPQLFGRVNSEVITGYQVGMAYLAGILVTPVIGVFASIMSMKIIPILFALFTLVLLVITESLNYVTKKNKIYQTAE